MRDALRRLRGWVRRDAPSQYTVSYYEPPRKHTMDVRVYVGDEELTALVKPALMRPQGRP